MKLLRIFVYVVLSFPWDLIRLVFVPYSILFHFIWNGREWAKTGNYATDDMIDATPFYTTIKTIKQIWKS